MKDNVAFVKVGHIKQRSSGRASEGLIEAIKYILNPEKTESKALVGSYMLPIGTDPTKYEDAAYKSMMDIKEAYSSGTGSAHTDTLCGRQGYHFILSFPADDDVTPEIALKITNEFCEKYLSEYQCIYAAHTNTDHLHTHIVFNSVSCYSGLKYHYARGEWVQNIQPIANDLCDKYGLQSLNLELEDKFKLQAISNKSKNNNEDLDYLYESDENSETNKHKEQSAIKHKKSHNYGKWVKDREEAGFVFKREKAVYYTNAMIKRDIDELISGSPDYDTFVRALESKGYVVDDSGKHLKVLAPGRQRYCRTYILSDNRDEYSKQGIIDRINGTYIDRKSVMDSLFNDWREYLMSDEYNHIKKRTSLSIAQANEELNLALKKHIWTSEDVELYKTYLNAADKQLNIVRKRINTTLEEHGEYIDKLRNVISLKKYYDRYKEGNEFFKADADKFMSDYTDIKQSRYNFKQLYDLDKYGNHLIKVINDYKKHLYVERKICERIEKKLSAVQIAPKEEKHL
ncbi:MAG: relaxase/mobilization nuclease domain-containing protein [Eubacterium sp.]|nr:relaxase/mobilization nuclease domain-containing protein [Eubacterium sp.]